MINATVSGEQIANGRLGIVKRAVDIIKHKNPDIDWDSNNLVITVVPKTEGELEGL